jgi:hypothetical protein
LNAFEGRYPARKANATTKRAHRAEKYFVILPCVHKTYLPPLTMSIDKRVPSEYDHMLMTTISTLEKFELAADGHR